MAMFRNFYQCPCGAEWTDEWSATCHDRCPECDTSCSPVEREDLPEQHTIDENKTATLGRIGYEGRYDYAAIGNVTILASRLSAKAAAGQILVSQRLNAAIEERIETDPIGELELKGMSRPVPAFSVARAKA